MGEDELVLLGSFVGPNQAAATVEGLLLLFLLVGLSLFAVWVFSG